ncbi:hypothetical protein GCM10009798_33410 [Nocardioides panacihumi]|uniref:Uncharacterized protein n=1 Tax=Nocardioides panacihumi TaxID=400774 RepID=A0ABP5CWC1_9ACTN
MPAHDHDNHRHRGLTQCRARQAVRREGDLHYADNALAGYQHAAADWLWLAGALPAAGHA